MSILQHYCDDPSCNKPEMSSLLLLCPCGTMEYCGRSCQRRHWKVHKSSHFEAINVTNKKKQIAADEAKDFPTESFIQHTNVSRDDSPEVRDLLIDILKAYTEDIYEGLMIYTKNVPAPYGYGKYYPFRFIGNGDHAHSEVTHYIAKEVPGIEVEHTHCCKLESRAKSFLSEYKYRSIELPPELYVKFCSDVMNRTFWFRIDGEKQYDLRSRKFLCRGHIAPVSWDGTLDVLNSAGQCRGLGGNVFDKSKVDSKFLREGEDGLRWSQETIDKVEAMDMDDIMARAGITQNQTEQQEGEEEGQTSTVTPQKLESP